MSDKRSTEWVLPAAIPFAALKGKDLEECIYWLLDALGAKDLEWRTGGSGGGAADGGRDLEAHFFTPGADSEIEMQTWWIECKGRAGTVEADEVKSAIINAQSKAALDYVVVATNTQFSNPTRDWVKEWQASHPRPKIKLWEHTDLERLLSRHPEVVLRLFSEALSLPGRFQAMESRFWNRLEFVPPKTLSELWISREDIELTAMGLFAATANEFANGSIVHRPWGAFIDTNSLLQVLQIGLINTPYLLMRSHKSGVDEKPILRTYAYLILCALDALPAENVTQLIADSIYRDHAKTMPDDIKEFLLMPITDQLLSEVQDICTADCKRMSVGSRRELTEDDDEIENYWLRLDPDGLKEKQEERKRLIIEIHEAPCVVGFSVNKDNGCPLFAVEPSINNVEELLSIIKRVAAFRKMQAADKSRT